MAAKGVVGVEIHRIKDHLKDRVTLAHHQARRVTRHRLRQVPLLIWGRRE